MEDFLKVLKVIGKILVKVFEVGMFACMALCAAKDLSDYLESDDV